jgi:nucleoside-diphosphate-sugar epimerase
VVSVLSDSGWGVRPFDLADGDDVRDQVAVREALRGCDAVVHAAAIPNDRAGTAADIVTTNVVGTWNVLLAAETERVSRVIVFSSAQVFGFLEGEGVPAYRPVDDGHPVRATRAYGMSKRIVEDMCEAWTTRTGIATIVLRPAMILDDADLRTMNSDAAELGAFVHVDDVAVAVGEALVARVDGHLRAILCGPGDFDSTVAREAFGWQPTRTWPSRKHADSTRSLRAKAARRLRRAVGPGRRASSMGHGEHQEL